MNPAIASIQQTVYQSLPVGDKLKHDPFELTFLALISRLDADGVLLLNGYKSCSMKFVLSGVTVIRGKD